MRRERKIELAWFGKPGLDAQISARLLEALVRWAAILSAEMSMDITDDGVVSCVAHESHIAIVETKVARSAFMSYDAVPGWVGFDLRSVRNFLAAFVSAGATAGRFDSALPRDIHPQAGDDIIAWQIKDELSLHGSGTELSIRLLHDASHPKELLTTVAKKWPHVVEAKVSSESLKEAVKCCGSSCRAVVIEADNNGLTITSRQGQTLKYSLRARTEWKGNRSPARSALDLAFMWPMVKEIPDSLEVTIGLGNDCPLVMEWHLGEYLKTHFAVCPLIDKKDK